MKKIFSITGLLAFILILVGCESEATTSYKRNYEGITSTITYTHKEDKVIKQTNVNEITYSSIGISNKEDAKPLFDIYANSYDNIEGIDHSIEYLDDKIVEELTVYFNKLDIESARDLPNIIIEGDHASDINLKQREDSLIAAGYEKL